MKTGLACWVVAVLALFGAGCHGLRPSSAAAPVAAGVSVQQGATLAEFQRRVVLARRQVPNIIAAAEAAAQRAVEHPGCLIQVPYDIQWSFAEEIINRSGGLANALQPEKRPNEQTPYDVCLLGVRSWEVDGARMQLLAKDLRQRGWLVVMFASKAGAPDDLQVDYLIDNGAPRGGQSLAPVNSAANVLNAWLWSCEYAAALTRHGKAPGILKSILARGGEAHNAPLQRPGGRQRLFDCSTPVPPGRLALAYLAETEALVRELWGDRVQAQIGRAADAITAQLRTGGKVQVTTATHFLMGEIYLDNRTPWKPFTAVWVASTAFAQNVGKNDLLVWFSFRGLSSPYEDYGAFMRQTGAALVTCYVADADPSNNAPNALAHIDQSWRIPDAVVPVPFAPGFMAPVSGINQGLVYRMLDEAVAARLADSNLAARPAILERMAGDNKAR